MMDDAKPEGQAETHGLASTVDYIGPFDYHHVVVNGWVVPFVEAHPMPGGQVNLLLDGRFGLDLSIADAERVIPFVANAIAIASGYTAHPTEDWEPARVGIPHPRRLFRLDMGEPEQSLGGRD